MNYPACLLAMSLPLIASAKLETWPNLDGRSTEAELVSTNGKYVSFRKADGTSYLYPLAKLSEADQIRVRKSTGKALVADATTTTPAEAPVPPAQVGKLTTEIAGKLVSAKNKQFAPFARENVAGAKYYAIYFSAHWCPPCRGFTPELVAAYADLKAKNPDFEVVFISRDESTDDMMTYMTEYKMPWPAIRFDAVKAIPAIERYRGRGIPNLVFVTADGEILSSSFVDGEYVGPQKVLRDIQKKLSKKS